MSATNDNVRGKKDGPSNFEKFIQSKLSQSPASSTGKFVLPKISFSTKISPTEEQKTIEENKIRIIAKEIHKLNLNELHISNIEQSNNNCIDLTEALNVSNKYVQGQILHDPKIRQSEENFDIPFLDDDLDMINNETKNSLLRQSPFTLKQMNKKYERKSNSKIGRIFKLNYYCTNNISVDHSFKSNPLITSFDFSTKSPDDKILESFSRKAF